MDNDEGFQSEPEVILIDARANEENGDEANEGEIISEENDENEAPSNEQDNQDDDDEVSARCARFILIISNII